MGDCQSAFRASTGVRGLERRYGGITGLYVGKSAPGDQIGLIDAISIERKTGGLSTTLLLIQVETSKVNQALLHVLIPRF